MENLQLKLLTGEIITLTSEDIKLWKPQIDKAFENLSKPNILIFKTYTKEKLFEQFEKMTDGELFQLAKENDENYMTWSGYKVDSFTLKIWQELCKRTNSLGYKQIGHLSQKQTDYLDSIGLTTRPWKRKQNEDGL